MNKKSTEFTLIEKQKGYGVYEKKRVGETSWIIAKIPAFAFFSESPPSSVLRDFQTAEVAVSTLKKWATDPPQPETSNTTQIDSFAGIRFEPAPSSRKRKRRTR
jgi:hypothetical protein